MNGTDTRTEGPLRFTGYAAIFDAIDRGGDVIRPGAFANSLARLRRPNGAMGLPLLWQHDATRPIGTVENLAEDDRGLRITGQLFAAQATPGNAIGRDVAKGTVSGLSFGYRVAHSRHGRAGAPRELLALDLVEISLVTAPMQPLARIHAVEKTPSAHSVEPILPP